MESKNVLINIVNRRFVIQRIEEVSQGTDDWRC